MITEKEFIELEARIVDNATPNIDELASEWNRIPESIASGVLIDLLVEAREMGLGDVTLFELGEASTIYKVPS